MKSLNLREIEQIVSRLKSLEGARLNAVYCQSPLITFELYRAGATHYLVLDLTASCPLALLFDGPAPLKLLKKQKPVSLFLKANFVGKALLRVEFKSSWGRLIKLYWGGSDNYCVEVRLFPHGQNLIVSTAEKSISWSKVKGLVASADLKGNVLGLRTFQEIADEWTEGRKQTAKKSKTNFEAEFKKIKIKLSKTIGKLESDLNKTEAKQALWRKVVEQLSNDPNSPIEEDEEIDFTEVSSTGKKLELAFSKVKLFEKKKLRQKERLVELIKELESLSVAKIKENQKIKKTSRSHEELKAKRWTLPSGLLLAVGRNAKENVELLRKAKPWDIWLHLKDYPGAYGFIYRNRNQKVSTTDLTKAAQWVAKMSLKKKDMVAQGGAVDLVYTECRYLQLIKGDKLGRVSYKNGKTLRITAE